MLQIQSVVPAYVLLAYLNNLDKAAIRCGIDALSQPRSWTSSSSLAHRLGNVSSKLGSTSRVSGSKPARLNGIIELEYHSSARLRLAHPLSLGVKCFSLHSLRRSCASLHLIN